MEDRHIFGQAHIEQGFMNHDEIKRYIEHFEFFCKVIDKPQVIVYLRSEVDIIADRIKSRGRDMENDINLDYLKSLQKLYDEKLVPVIEKDFTDIILLKYDTDFETADDVVERIVEDLMKLEANMDPSLLSPVVMENRHRPSLEIDRSSLRSLPSLACDEKSLSDSDEIVERVD